MVRPTGSSVARLWSVQEPQAPSHQGSAFLLNHPKCSTNISSHPGASGSYSCSLPATPPQITPNPPPSGGQGIGSHSSRDALLHTHTPHAGVGVWHRTPVSGRWLPNAFLGVLPEHLSSQCPGSPFSVSRPASPSYSEVAVWRQAVGEARRVEAGAEVGSSSSLL